MLKIGIVGAGIIGRAHASAIMNNPDCRLEAVCDSVKEKALEIAKIHNAKCFTDYREMAESVDLDAVIINLPHFLHCEATVFFLDKKINVLIEKPMAMSVEECDRMIMTAEKSGAKLAIGHVQRYYSAYREVKEIVENGRYGKLCMITEVRNDNYLQGRPEWFLKKELSGGGIVMNFGAHTLDKIMYVTGQKLIGAETFFDNPISEDDVEINAQLLLRLSEGASAMITYCGCPGNNTYETVFYFEQGVAAVVNGYDLYLSENGKMEKHGGTSNLLSEQLSEFVKFLKDEENIIVTPEYGKEIIHALELIYKK